ncbi:ATP-binding protein [Acidithiobacillus ferrooxidans]|uniref:AAA family ATPase n=1 Tax=Acidithiobacillus ferrooxidans TaxID=920 RepID=UPI00214CC7F9|nr:ATP-binding protein [Acidithiobacillus ferrooxidans]MCR2832205.1 ATP-binding protein [Acidithiobacillus ferrooxidans]
MDLISNPFSPGAGAPPPELVGRSTILEQADTLMARVQRRRAEQSLMLTGLRGVGKTVLLTEIARRARAAGYRTISIEAHTGKNLAALLIPPLRELLYDLNRVAGLSHKAKQGLAVLRGFVGALRVKVSEVEFSLDIEPQVGAADSGDLEADLPRLFQAVAEAALEQNALLVLLIDEIQYLNKLEFSALIMAMHQMQQQQLPLVLIGAGLPILPALAGQSKSYAERLFAYPQVGPLNAADVVLALQDPAKKAGVSFTEEALLEIFRITKGYPYFVQEWGYISWNSAPLTPIGLRDVQTATPLATQRLDSNFFRVRFDRLTRAEKTFLRAMAELGSGPYRFGDIVSAMAVEHSALGPVRAKMIKEGMIYSPAHGLLDFTVPLFDEFLRRAIPDPRDTAVV